jgi:hypothetical protein
MSEQVHVGERIMKNIKNKNAKKWESKSKYYLFTNAEMAVLPVKL